MESISRCMYVVNELSRLLKFKFTVKDLKNVFRVTDRQQICSMMCPSVSYANYTVVNGFWSRTDIRQYARHSTYQL